MAGQKEDVESKIAAMKREMEIQSKMAEKKDRDTESKMTAMTKEMAEQKKEIESKMIQQKKEIAALRKFLQFFVALSILFIAIIVCFSYNKMEVSVYQKQVIESKMVEQKKEIESKVAAMTKETENKMAEQKIEMESMMAAMKKETENKMADQKIEMESKMASMKKETENKMVEQKKNIQALRTHLQNVTFGISQDTIKISMIEETVAATKESLPLMRGVLLGSHPVPCIELIMTEYSAHKKNKVPWYSSPFYTRLGGYKMGIRVDANGFGNGTGTHVSMHIYLFKGEYDGSLEWPFRGDITVQLVNSYVRQDHFNWIVDFRDASDSVSHRVLVGEISPKFRGNANFMHHTMVESSTENRRYLVNDSLTFRVTKVEIVQSV